MPRHIFEFETGFHQIVGIENSISPDLGIAKQHSPARSRRRTQKEF
jgi:hypothetical protein